MTGITLNIQSKHYRSDSTVIGQLSGTIAEGKITAIIGPSGCGKSTLLNMIAGLETANKGEISFSNTRSETPKIGYIFQTPRLMPWLTTKENLELIGGKGNPTIRETLASMGILDKLDDYPSQLSGGIQRRVSIARAFVYQPDLLLLDEPFTSLDAPTADQLREQLIALWQRQQSTMVFVTHDLHEALSLADEIWFLSRSPATCIHKLFVSQPPARLLAAEHRQTINELTANLLEAHPDILRGKAGQ
ncbi:ABC transporter ATP-binding protein [Enterovibrio coralii]|uniref:ABC transporter n=1 Tax=Enterovibrio coralii TaxID=294935 RepID=A0A135IA58_9GAMM|nr:ATP-binding cassette domain-containing protein [Enterovibrio coralii]KXF82278.1 ABC transporter [Enterovibrio coralii]